MIRFVVAVVSAMGDHTDRLVALFEEVDYRGLETRREMDVLLSTGEQVTISVLALFAGLALMRNLLT